MPRTCQPQLTRQGKSIPQGLSPLTCGNGNGQGCGSRRSGSFALDTLELAADFHKTGEPRFGTELRNREKVLGTTLDYLRGLRIRYVDAKPASPPAAVANIADYRDQ